MKVLVATDFSTRSDRALRRAILICKKHGAQMLLVHAIDSDRAPRLVAAEREVAASLLQEHARSLTEVDGVTCVTELLDGDPYEAITQAAERHAADLVVIGPHRRHVIEDAFVGTTAELIIKASRCPVLMSNGVPAGFYSHAVLALELAESGRTSVATTRALGLDKHVGVTVLHVADSPLTGLLATSAMSDAEVQRARLEEDIQVSQAVSRFLSSLAFTAIGQIVAANEGSIASTILSVAARVEADLLILGTECRSGIKRLLLGSVAEEVLRAAKIDVLAIPPSRHSADGQL